LVLYKGKGTVIINLTTPLSDDKERQRRNEVILAAIERHTEERMNDEYGRIHTDGSRSGGQPVKSDVNERLGAWLSAALDDPNCSDAFKQDINDWFASQPTQSDALQAENEQLRHDLERLRVEAKAQFDRGYYDGCTRAALNAAGFEIKEKSK
jgi:hypothetical protein